MNPETRAAIIERLRVGLPVVGGHWRAAKKSFSGKPYGWKNHITAADFTHAVRILLRHYKESEVRPNDALVWQCEQVIDLLEETEMFLREQPNKEKP